MAFSLGSEAAFNGGPGTPVTTTLTAEANSVLVLSIVVVGSTSRTGGAPTFSGVAMTQAGTTQTATETNTSVWYLINPSTAGSQTLSIPNAGGLDLWCHWATFIPGAGKTPAFDVAGGNAGSTANPSVSVTTTESGDAVFAAMGNGLATAPTAQSGTNLERADRGAFSTNAQYTIAGAAGSIASSWTVGADDWGLCVAAFKEVTSSTDYPLTAAQGSYALTGQPSLFKLGHRVLSAVGSFSFTGFASNFKATRRLTSAFGAFTLSGQASFFRWGRKIVGAVGSFTLSGFNTVLSNAKRLVASLGTFTVAGQTSTFSQARRIVLATGSFALIGILALLVKGTKLLASAGTYALSGQNAVVSSARRIVAVFGNYVLNGQTSVFKITRSITAVYGAFALTGQALALSFGRKIVAVYGAFALTGQNVLFRIGRVMIAVYGTLTLNWQPFRLLKNGLLVIYNNLFTARGTSSNDKFTPRNTNYADKNSSRGTDYADKYNPLT